MPELDPSGNGEDRPWRQHPQGVGRHAAYFLTPSCGAEPFSRVVAVRVRNSRRFIGFGSLSPPWQRWRLTTKWISGCPLQVSLVVQWCELLEQCPIEVVIAPHHQLRVDGAVLVGGVGSSAHRSGCLLPLLEEARGHLATHPGGGVLPGHLGAVAHLHRVLARALDRGVLGGSSRGQHCQQTQQR